MPSTGSEVSDESDSDHKLVRKKYKEDRSASIRNDQSNRKLQASRGRSGELLRHLQRAHSQMQEVNSDNKSVSSETESSSYSDDSDGNSSVQSESDSNDVPQSD